MNRVADPGTDAAIAAAHSAGLHYASDVQSGIRRRRTGKGFSYIGPEGSRIDDADELARIRSLAVPPAWADVWISPDSRGHVQATGRDSRGRKQYRYHPKWREVRDETKYGRVIEFGRSLPRIRRRVQRDLDRPGLPREKVLAAVIRLLDATLIRVGNDEYARDNGSFGLTTMRDRHVNVFGSTLRFRFRGKGGKEVVADVTDRRLARVVKRCQDLPGEELFQYVDDEGQLRDIRSEDVNLYLREITREDFTAKDFRTWGGTASAAVALRSAGPFRTRPEAKRKVAEAVSSVARGLGNTPAVCRACYIHPRVIQAYLDRTFARSWSAAMRTDSARGDGLRPEEAALLVLLRKRSAA